MLPMPNRPLLILALLLLPMMHSARAAAEASDLHRAMVTLELQLDRPLRSGSGAPKANVTLATLPGVGRAALRIDARELRFGWEWDDAVDAPPAYFRLPELDGGDDGRVTLRWAWNAADARLLETLDGVPQRDTAARFPEPWTVPTPIGPAAPGAADDLEPLGLTVIDVRLERDAAIDNGDLPPPPSPGTDATPMDVEDRLGPPLFQTGFDTPGALDGWIIEGPAVPTFENGRLVLRSSKPEARRPDHGHFTLWAPVDLPEAYVVDWTFEPLKREGLAIVFFDARPNVPGVTDLTDPRLEPRDGTFRNYVAGDLDSHHISYYAQAAQNPGRAYANLRKNRGLRLMALGTPALQADDLEATPRAVHMRLIRDGHRIQLQADGRVILDATDDDPARFGPPLNGGRLGLRQMQWTHAAYDDLTVYPLR